MQQRGRNENIVYVVTARRKMQDETPRHNKRHAVAHMAGGELNTKSNEKYKEN